MSTTETPTADIIVPDENTRETAEICSTCGEHVTPGQCNDTGRGVHAEHPDEEKS